MDYFANEGTNKIYVLITRHVVRQLMDSASSDIDTQWFGIKTLKLIQGEVLKNTFNID